MKKEEIAKYAYENVPFYSDIIKEDNLPFDEYPIIEKAQILKNKDRLFSPEYIRELNMDRLEHVFTSGSTGDCLEILWKKSQSMKAMI